MKIRTTIATLSLALLATGVFAQNDAGTAYDLNGKVVFAESKPATPYRHLGTVSCAMFSPDNPDELVEHMLERAQKLADEEEKEYDAIILRQGSGFCKADVIAYYKDPKAKRSRNKGDEDAVNPEYKKSRANKREGIYVFVKNSPTSEINLMGKVELPATFQSSEVEDYMSEMIKVAKSKYPTLEGIVFIEGTELSKANVIQFK